MREPNQTFCEVVESALSDAKAKSIVKIDLFNKSNLCDYMFITTGTSNRHVQAIADVIIRSFKDIGVYNIIAEGDSNNWIVLDIGDVIVHIFQTESRDIYKLEDIWKRSSEKNEN